MAGLQDCGEVVDDVVGGAGVQRFVAGLQTLHVLAVVLGLSFHVSDLDRESKDLKGMEDLGLFWVASSIVLDG